MHFQFRNPNWIAIDGLDGTGKTTLALTLSEKINATYVRLPYDQAIREKFLDPAQGYSEYTKALLMAADSSMAIDNLEADSLTVFDRTFLSTMAYQQVNCTQVLEFAWRSMIPRYLFILDMDPVEAKNRTLIRANEPSGKPTDLFELEDLEVWNQRRQTYLNLSEKFGAIVLDARLPHEQLIQVIRDSIKL